ncbi:uncharacterized protein [Miscanthus floridulus]|uniref:uncharacterized protein n=1 Tax=Miscanthus floridulus TaxID=154761 RepID=UPI00345A807E
MEQLRAWKLEIDEAEQGLVWEYVDINREIERRKNGGRAHAMAHTPHRRPGLPPRPPPAQPPLPRPSWLAAAQHRAAPGLPPRACPRRAASCPDSVRARSPRGRPALATPAARQPRPGFTSTRAPSSAPQRCLLPITPPALSAAEQQQQLPPARNASSPLPPPLPQRQHTPPTPPFPDSRCQQLRLASLLRLRSLAAVVVEVRTKRGRLLPLRREHRRGQVARHAAGPPPPSQPLRLGVA